MAIIKKLEKNFSALAQEEGVVLILTLVIMAILLSTALGFAILILSDIKQANSIDNSIVAYYGADAGIEQSLFLFRKNSVEWVGQPASPQPGTLLAILGTGDIVLDNQAKWKIAESKDYEENFFRQRLNNGQSVKLYFLKRSAANRENNTDKIKVFWYKGMKANGTISDIRMQINFTQLNPQIVKNSEIDESPVLVYYTDQNPDPHFSDSNVDGGIEYSFKDEVLPNCISGCDLSYHDYVVEIKALAFDRSELGDLDDFIDNLKVVAYDKNSNVVLDGITNITIKSIGNFRGSQQEIIAHLPPKDPVSGLLGFVLFSEEDITKGY